MQEPVIPIPEAPQYEDIGFRPLPLPTPPPRSLVPAPAQNLSPGVISRNKSSSNPPTNGLGPLPVVPSKPKSSPLAVPTQAIVKQKVPPKSTSGHDNKARAPSIDRIPKKPVAVPTLPPKNAPANSAEPISSDHDSRRRTNSHSKASPSQQPMASPLSSVESAPKPQPEVSVSNNASSSIVPPKDDQSSYGTALFAINESLRLLLGKIEKMEQKQTQFDEDISLLKSQSNGGGDRKQPLEICSMTHQDVSIVLR